MRGYKTDLIAEATIQHQAMEIARLNAMVKRGNEIDDLVRAVKVLARFTRNRLEYEDECYEDVVNACCIADEWHIDGE